MRSSSRWLSVLTVLAATLLLPSSAGAAPALTAAPIATAPQKPATVTLVLEPRQPHALARLAAIPIRSQRQRRMALADALPSAGDRRRVAAVLAGRGFAVTGETGWTVQATAAPASVADTFGTRPTLPRKHTVTQFRAATGTLPDLPSSLDGLVSGVYPTTSGPQTFHQGAAAPLDGSDIRKADTPARVAPSTGRRDGRLTVATLQLSRFGSGSLTTYARNSGLADPVASGQYRAITVDGGPLDTDGAVEVALDQESLLSTAPTAHQRAYFAPNTGGGYIDALARVADDAIANPHIVALSISWGGCEALTGSGFIHAAEPVLRSLVAAGVTVFASSGDNGIYDCGTVTGTGSDDRQADVDYPASSPEVVAVGGTNLTTPSSTPNTGTNWTERAWTCSGPSTCEDSDTGTGGSGGGVSGSAYRQPILDGRGNFAGFPKPSWQQSAVRSEPYAATTTRMVPDIAADGDPQTGFWIFSSGSGWILVGGTSLAAPLSAAQLTNTLGDAGRLAGVGDIHAALYRAYTATRNLPATSPKKVFRDVTVGANGASGDEGADPSVSATTGYDTVSGLGAVLWKALTPYLPSVRKPAVTAHLATVRGASTRRRTAVRFGWTASQGRDPLPLASTSALIHTGRGRLFRSAARHGSKVLHVRPGARLTAVVTAADRAGQRTSRTVHLTAPRVRRR